MTRCARALVGWAALVVACLGHATPTGAHRLDEYLQAARLSVALDRVTLEMDLTPGVAVAPAVFATIDLDRSGEISAAEGEAYARQVVDSLTLTIDGRAAPLRLEGAEMPRWRDVSQGIGVIRLLASATLPAVATGTHRLYFRNTHRRETSAYLANTLVPTDSHVEITRQQRDPAQHELTVDYRVTAGWPQPSTVSWPFAAGLTLVLTATWLSMRRWGRRPGLQAWRIRQT